MVSLRCGVGFGVLGSVQGGLFITGESEGLSVSDAPSLTHQSGPQNKRRRRLVVITGLSGAGKTSALKAFEDAGYYCIDNLPLSMIPDVLALAPSEDVAGVVVVVDIRGRRYLGEEIEKGLGLLRGESASWEPRIVFIEADSGTLISRYKETRRPHPAATDGDVLSAIRAERQELSSLREVADTIMDTSGLSAGEVKERFARLVGGVNRLSVSLISFGFKYGIPLDVDMLLDVRFLPNPHYDPELRPLTGRDEPVRNAVLGQSDTKEFLARVRDLLVFLIPRYVAEGKTYFTLGVGCTGGRHRSVTIVEDLARYLMEEGGDGSEIELFIRHRDLEAGG
jgi:RNase adapter protein RapZ